MRHSRAIAAGAIASSEKTRQDITDANHYWRPLPDSREPRNPRERFADPFNAWLQPRFPV